MNGRPCVFTRLPISPSNHRHLQAMSSSDLHTELEKGLSEKKACFKESTDVRRRGSSKTRLCLLGFLGLFLVFRFSTSSSFFPSKILNSSCLSSLDIHKVSSVLKVDKAFSIVFHTISSSILLSFDIAFSTYLLLLQFRAIAFTGNSVKE